VTAGIIFFNDYLSFLIFGIVCSMLAAIKMVNEASGERNYQNMPAEKHREIREMSRNRELFLFAVVLAGLIIGTALFIVKQFLVLLV